MDFIKTQVRDELGSSLACFSVLEDMMDRVDNIEVIQLALESRCDNMVQKKICGTEEIRRSIFRLEDKVQ